MLCEKDINSETIDNKFIDISQRNHILEFRYKKIENKKLVKAQGYGVIEKGCLNQIVAMKHIPKKFIINDKEKLEEYINDGNVQISNSIFLELNVEASSSISLQNGMSAFIDPELLKNPTLKFALAFVVLE
ncbi:hypothetical protein C2G38_2159158 [Gigaspora rosea]|uniref:Uncharacterized protein n=1 Tax=Gigaspora rosea TaxID=44941 RepID=A0A397W320_9GLOM|nr:hypothetical protein C2G38_2159158 [Gigaspora rosea]